MIASLIIGTLLGVLTTTVIFRWVKSGNARMAQQLTDAIDQSNGRGILGSTRALLVRPQWIRALNWVIWPLLPIVNPVYYFSAMGMEGLVFTITYFVTYLGSIAVGYRIWGKNILSNHILTQGRIVAVKAVRYQPEKAGEILIPAAQDSDPTHREACIPGLVELGTPEALKALQALANDPVPSIATLAKGQHERLQEYLVHPKAEHKELPTTVWRKPHNNEQGDDAHGGRIRVDDRKKALQIMAEQDVLAILLPQLPLRRAFPNLYCKTCHATAMRYRYGEWDWVECRICEKSGDLEIGVRQVFGVIGAEEDWQLDAKGTLHLRIWDAEKRTVVLADIQELHVIGGKDIDYDWAISATLEAMAKRPTGWSIVYHPPLKLSQNTLLLLQAGGFPGPSGHFPS